MGPLGRQPHYRQEVVHGGAATADSGGRHGELLESLSLHGVGCVAAKWVAPKLPFGYARNWPGRAKAEFKLAAENQSSKVGQFGRI